MLYFDSCVWISYVLPRDKHHFKAVNQLERIERGEDEVIVSSQVILEFLDVIRKRIVQEENYVGLNNAAKTRIKTKIDAITRKFMNMLTLLAHEHKVMIANPNQNLTDYLHLTQKILIQHFGDIGEFSFCFTCNRSTPTRYRYRGMGHYDIQHAINAKDAKADEIVSFDQPFRFLNDIDGFSSLKVTVL